jgi:hypothetical protein
VQVPVLQLDAALARVQATPQPPQCVVVLSDCSQPLVALLSQLPKPPLQVPRLQVPVLQLALAFGRVQATLQPPQWALVLSGCSQVVPSLSQSALPEGQLDNEQTPPEQVRASLTPQAALQAPQWVLLVSGVSQPLLALPSQLPQPGLQAPRVQVPEPQLAAALVRLHVTLQPPQWVLLVSACSQPLASLASQLP